MVNVYIYIYIYICVCYGKYIYTYIYRNSTGEYIGVYRHFYMTYMHILRGRNSTSCTLVRGDSQGEIHIPIWKRQFL